jgi:hypothetical protein
MNNRFGRFKHVQFGLDMCAPVWRQKKTIRAEASKEVVARRQAIPGGGRGIPNVEP